MRKSNPDLASGRIRTFKGFRRSLSLRDWLRRKTATSRGTGKVRTGTRYCREIGLSPLWRFNLGSYFSDLAQRKMRAGPLGRGVDDAS
jgi:hypothetical protein